LKPKVVFSNTGLIIYEPETPAVIRFDRDESQRILKRKVDFSRFDDHLEIAHLEITSRCNLKCSYCYAKNTDGDLPTGEWKRIIRELADFGIFQITLGGGEPALREDFIELAEYSMSFEVNVAITTNGTIPISEEWRVFRQVNISYKPELGTEYTVRRLSELAELGIPRGINFILNRPNKPYLDEARRLSREYDAELLLLSYKPVIGDWSNVIPADEIYQTGKMLHDEGIKVAVDGYTTFAFAGADCGQSKRFITVNTRGQVLRCSFIREPFGDLTKQSINEIWASRGNPVPCPFLLRWDQSDQNREDNKNYRPTLPQ